MGDTSREFARAAAAGEVSREAARATGAPGEASLQLALAWAALGVTSLRPALAELALGETSLEPIRLGMARGETSLAEPVLTDAEARALAGVAAGAGEPATTSAGADGHTPPAAAVPGREVMLAPETVPLAWGGGGATVNDCEGEGVRPRAFELASGRGGRGGCCAS
mmetsp:Transcript_137476/g.383398  ORF Transcript_137476/g.383398 Transcript_137476/m.383398 type:complete len:167 (-) Transcript_137476:2043-2543(-)